MKVILLVDDKKLGKKNSIVEVADSYARNVLIPKKIVVAATKESLLELQARISRDNYNYEKTVAEMTAVKNKIADLKAVYIKAKTSSTGKMFGSITAQDIADALAYAGINIKKQNIVIANQIKEFGEHTVTIKLFEGISQTLAVHVIQ